jgi:hypothetical protein
MKDHKKDNINKKLKLDYRISTIWYKRWRYCRCWSEYKKKKSSENNFEDNDNMIQKVHCERNKKDFQSLSDQSQPTQEEIDNNM